jgi:hypothetical protein
MPEAVHRVWAIAAAVLVAAISVAVAGSVVDGVPPADSRLAAPPAAAPQLIVDDSTVAADFRALADATWQQFLAVFAARRSCFGNVHLRADPALPDRGAYDPRSVTVTVRVPGTPALLRSALVHEWAHHVGFQCPEHRELRREFLVARGLPPTMGWHAGATWADVPAEVYAEAVVEVVLGRRSIPTAASVNRTTLQVVRTWLAADVQ